MEPRPAERTRGGRIDRFLGLALLAAALAPARARAATAEGHVLFFLRPSSGACSWTVMDPPTLMLEEVGRSDACPRAIVFDPAGRRVFYMSGDSVFERPWAPERKARPLAKVPKHPTAGYPASFWLSAESGRPRFAYMVEVPAMDVSGPEDAMVFSFEGIEHKATRWLPSWGAPAMAVVKELAPDGRWRRLAILPTKTEAGDTPGLDVFTGPLSEAGDTATRSVSAARLAEEATCVRKACDAPWEGDPGVARGLEEAWDEEATLGSRQVGARGHVIFGLVYGDTPHASGPLYWCKRGCSEPLRLEGDFAPQVTVSVSQPYFIVTEEYTGASLRLYRAGKAAPLADIPEAVGAVWARRESLPPPPKPKPPPKQRPKPASNPGLKPASRPAPAPSTKPSSGPGSRPAASPAKAGI